MARQPVAVAEFLAGTRLAVAGVSRDSRQPANAILRRLRSEGRTVYAINPHAAELEGAHCYASVAALPEPVDGVMIVTHPDAALDVVRECAARGVPRVWFHRSFGRGSVSEPAVRECGARGIGCIVGGCPLMFAEPVDVAHRCMRWWLQRSGKVPR